MSAAENKELIRHIYAELARGNAQAFLDSMADDVTWTLIGTTRFSGTFRGKQELAERLLGPVTGDLDGGLTITPENFIAEGEYVAMQSRGRSMTKYGKRYDNTYCHVFRIVEGKIREATEYCDTELVTEAFRP